MADLKARNLIARDLFPIPSNPTPEGLKCVQILIPDDIEHEAVFAGALALLKKWNSWQKDGTTNARDCANTWKAALQAGIEACEDFMFDVRQNEDEPCKLEKQIDGGAWVEFADLQLCPPRVRTDKGKLQFWDGTQWVDLPQQGDEKYDGEADPPFPDPPPGETGNCLAAENLTALLAQQVGDWETALTAGAIALGIVTIITGVLSAFFIPYATPALLGFATTIIGIGATGLATEFTSAVYDRFKCIINANASADGSITLEQYEDILTEIQAESGTAWDLIEVWVTLFGPVGFTRAGNAAGITTGDCDACQPLHCRVWNFATGAGQFDIWTTPGTGALGIYQAGVGYKMRNYSGVNNQVTIISKFAVQWRYMKITYVVSSPLGGTQHSDVAYGTAVNTVNGVLQAGSLASTTLEWSGTYRTDFPVASAFNAIAGGSNIWIVGLELHYRGTDPFSTGTLC